MIGSVPWERYPYLSLPVRIEGHHDFAVLERRLAEAISGAQAEGGSGLPAPVAVVAPTRRLLAHLQERLATLCRALVNVHFFHHASLARAMARHAGRAISGPIDEGVLQAILGELIRRRGGEPARYAAERPGSLSALLATLEDLREAGIPADAAPSVPGLSSRGREILELHAAWSETLERFSGRGLVDRTAALRLALHGAERFARPFRTFIHYGAYDLIGANLDLMQAIAAAGVPVLYLVPHHAVSPAFAAARRFWPASLGLDPGPVAGAAAAGPRPGGGAREAGPALADRLPLLYDEGARPPAIKAASGTGPVSLFHAQGAAAEIRETARRVLSLHERTGLPLRRLAVIGRSLEPYAPFLRAVFREHGLPFVTSAGLGALREARVQAALDLARVVCGDYERVPLFDLFRSGLVRDDGREPTADVDAWDRLSRDWHVTGGYRAWTEALPAMLRDWEPSLPEEADADTRERARQAADRLRRQSLALAAAVRLLARTSGPARRARGWRDWGSAMEDLLRETLDGFRRDDPGHDAGASVVLDLLAGADALEAAAVPFSPGDGLAFLERGLGRAVLPIGAVGADGSPGAGDNGGVRVLDAMQARGLTFDAVFLIGFNADLFPRHARQDPFLDDADREALRARFRRPLPIKSEAAEEEHLLLAHLLGAASRSLTISWQRADEAGRARVPSLALREVARVALGSPDLGRARDAALRVPIHPADEGRSAADRLGLLPAAEAAVDLFLQARSPAHLRASIRDLPARPSEEDREALDDGLSMIEAIESFSPSDLRYDGFVGGAVPPPEAWSPSRLERLGACPQHYFFRHALRVEELTDPAEACEIGMQEIGSCVHRVLSRVYGGLAGRDLPGASGPGGIEALVRSAEEEARAAWDEFAAPLARRMAGRLPLLWSALSDLWIDAVCGFLRRDLPRLAAAGARVVGLEAPHSVVVPLGPAGREVSLRGRFDRLACEGGGMVVVADYKTSGNLRDHVRLADALKGSRLQIPLYMLMAGRQPPAGAAPGAPVRGEVLGVGPAFAAAGAADDETREIIDPGSFEKCRGGLLETILVLQDLATTGAFPLNEESRVCRYCPYLRACRRSHAPTLARLRAAGGAAAYRRLRDKNTRSPRIGEPAADGEPS